MKTPEQIKPGPEPEEGKYRLSYPDLNPSVPKEKAVLEHINRLRDEIIKTADEIAVLKEKPLTNESCDALTALHKRAAALARAVNSSRKAKEAINPEAHPESLSFLELENWLKANDLEKHIEGGSLEAQITAQEKFYQARYGPGFKIDRSQIGVEKSRLENIKKGLENGAVDYALLTVVPEEENLAEDEKQMTEAAFFYHKLMKAQGMKIWEETGTERWTKLTLDQVLKGYIPVEIADFENEEVSEKNWIEKFMEIINKKEQTPEIKPGQIQLTFTNSEQDVNPDKKLISQDGHEVDFPKKAEKLTFIEMIKSKVRVLTPGQWIALAGQKYAEDNTYLSRNTWDWMMAILKNKEGTNPPASAAIAISLDGGVFLNSDGASDEGSDDRWRLSL